MSVAKYQMVHSELLQRLASGQWVPGTNIPNEVDLAREFGCTRPTISRALRMLVEAGLIERKKKAGSRVAKRVAREATFRIPIVREEIQRRGGIYSYLCLERSSGDAPDHVRSVFGTAGENLHIKALHFENGRPCQLEDRWINLTTVPRARDEPFDVLSPNEWLVGEIPYSRAEHILRSRKPSAEEKRILRLEPDEPVFVIQRTTWFAAEPVTVVDLIHPANSYRIVTRDLSFS